MTSLAPSAGRALVIATALLSTQCLTPAAERAERDSTIGQAATASYAVTVVDGLAAVRRATDTELELWQSAPNIVVELMFSEPAALQLEIGNLMPNATIRLESGNADIEEVPSSRPKAQRVRISPTRAGRLTLAIGPENTTVRPFRFALMSDVQEAISNVADIYETVNRQPHVEFLLGAGDLTQRGEEAQLTRFEHELERLEVPYYTTLGNHELGVDPPPYQRLFGRGSFSFTYCGVRFTLLDSASATLDPLVYEWLDTWLTQGIDQFHVVAMHIPPIDPIGVRNGSFASRIEANKLFARLSKANVDLTLYGHIHSFYDFENASIPAVISGGGGAIPERFDHIGRHFVVFKVDPTAQTFSKRIVRVD